MKKVIAIILMYVAIILAYVAITFTVIIGGVALRGCEGDNLRVARKTVKEGTGIDLPSKIENLYYNSSGGRDGLRYYVFMVEEDLQEWLEENLFKEGKDTEFEERYNHYFDLFREDSVPEKYCVDFEKDYYYWGERLDFLIFLSDESLLIYLKMDY